MFEPLVLVRKILETNETIYYSCRAPDSESVLVAESYKVDFEAKLSLLQKRYEEVMESANLTTNEKCSSKGCACRRDCLQISFLPRVNTQISFSAGHLYALQFDCFAFGNLISAAELSEKFCVTMPTAYRLTISLLTLVDRLVRLNVSVDISVKNLLIDTVSSAVTLIDWSSSTLFTILPIKERTGLYRQAAEVILELTEAKQDEVGRWSCLAGFEDSYMHSLFDLLHEISIIQLDIPDKLGAAIEYISELYEKQNLLIGDIVDSLRYVNIDPGKPLFEIIKKKMEEKDDGRINAGVS